MSAYDSNPTLPSTKVDSHSATTPSNQTMTAAEFNAMNTAIADLRAALVGGTPSEGGAANYFALAQNSSRPSAAATQAVLATDGASVLAAVNGNGYQLVGDPKRINVKDPRFGAKGDGTTDDTAAINAALAAGAQTGISGGGVTFYNGAEIYFPAGIYKITGALTYYSGSRIKGDNAIIKVAASTTAFTLNYNAWIEGLVFWATNGDANSLAIKIANGNVGAYVQVKDCWFIDIKMLNIDNNSASTTCIFDHFCVLDTYSSGDLIAMSTGDDVFFSNGAIASNRANKFHISGGNFTIRDVLGTPPGNAIWALVDGGLSFNAYRVRFGGEGGGDDLVHWSTAPNLIFGGGSAQVPSRLVIEDCEVYGYGVKFYNLPMATRIHGNTGDAANVLYDSTIPLNVRALIGDQFRQFLEGNYNKARIDRASDEQIVSMMNVADDLAFRLGHHESYLTQDDRALLIPSWSSAWGQNIQPTNVTNGTTTDPWGETLSTFTPTNQSLEMTISANWYRSLNGQTAGLKTMKVPFYITGSTLAEIGIYAGGKQLFGTYAPGRHVLCLPFEMLYDSLSLNLWQTSHAYNIGDLVVADHSPYGHANVFRCVHAGTSGTDGTVFQAGYFAQQVTDGGAIWEWIQDLSVGVSVAIPPGSTVVAIGDISILNGLRDLRTDRQNFVGTAAPTKGRWQVGDFVKQAQPGSGVSDGFECSVAGGAASGAWQSSHTYAVGDCVTNDSGKVFQCTQAGMSAGSGGPTGSEGTMNIADNAAVWNSIANSQATFVAKGASSNLAQIVDGSGHLNGVFKLYDNAAGKFVYLYSNNGVLTLQDTLPS